MLRTEVGRNITARLTPSLEFIADAIPENAEHIEALLREARDARRRDRRRSPSTAEYAGDADPYVKPRDLEDDADDGTRSTTRHPTSPTTRGGRFPLVRCGRRRHAAGPAASAEQLVRRPRRCVRAAPSMKASTVGCRSASGRHTSQ